MTADNTAIWEIAGGHRPPLQWPSPGRAADSKPLPPLRGVGQPPRQPKRQSESHKRLAE